MKVLQINSVVNYSSTGRIVEEIGNLLQNKGHKSFIAHSNYNPIRGEKHKSNSQLIGIGSDLTSYLHGIYTLLTDKHGFGSKKATQNFIGKIKILKPDIIALYNLHGYYINIEILFKFLHDENIPVVWTLFDCWAFTGHCTYYDDIDCIKWKTACNNCPKSIKYPKSYVDNSNFNFRKKKQLFTSLRNLEFITHSQWLADQVSMSFLKDFKTNVTPSAINLDLFKPIKSEFKYKYNLSDYKVILGCASVWNERKGLDDLIKLDEILDKNYKLVLIGLSEKQINNLPKSIIGINRTNSVEDLAKWYTLASVFVNPTTQDNFPTTNIEALACGTPVVTYNTGGSPEAIDMLTGRVVSKNDIKGLVKNIYEICSIDENIISKNCRKRAEKLFDKKLRYLDYINIFENLLENKKI